MIAFRCGQCGKEFEVGDEFAGRTTRCSTCKKPITVPPVDATLAHMSANVPTIGILNEGKGDDASRTSASAGKIVPRLSSPCSGNAGRYEMKEEIARGGMGAILRALDRDLRRDVAVKFMLDRTN